MAFLVMVSFMAFMTFQSATAQSWNITGNSNTTSSSKLGTTNVVPLRFFTNNSERLRIDASGNVGIGTSNPLNILTIQLNGTAPVASWLAGGSSLPSFLAFGENQSTGFNLATAANASGYRPVLNTRRSRGTLAAPTAVANDDFLASFVASGYDGSTFQNPATIDFYVDGIPSSGNVPGRISFVTGTNKDNRRERLKVGSGGDFNFNSGQVFLRQSNGFTGIGTITPAAKLNVVSTDLVSLSSPGYLILGTTANFNMGLDFQQIQARKNGAASTLFLNNNGGTVQVGNSLSSHQALLAFGSDYGLYGVAEGTGVYGQGNTYGGYFSSSSGPGVYGSTGNASSYAGYFQGNVFTTGTYTPSDEKLKQNIEDFPGAMNIISQLHPKQYQFRHDGNYRPMNLPQGQHYGLIAQDVEKLFPELVKVTKFDVDRSSPALDQKHGDIQNHTTSLTNPAEAVDFKAINYTELIPVLIKGMQEQQSEIGKLSADNKKLQSEIEELKLLIIKNDNSISNVTPGSYLKQNVPNPVNNSTIIPYHIDENLRGGQINIADEKGRIIKRYNVVKGDGELNIQRADLPAGNYFYTLYINEKTMDTKKMVITR